MGSKSLTRSRWAAIGAAVAVTLGGGGLIGVSAASGDASSLKTVDPVRILDTREGDDAAKVSNGTKVLKVTGEIPTYVKDSDGVVSIEDATVVPDGAGAVSMNLTVSEGSRNQGYGFVTAFPCADRDAKSPNASTLNFVEGVDVANSTVVPIDASGNICLYVYGSAHVIVDVNGYYETAAGTVDAYTKAESDAKYVTDAYTKAQSDSFFFTKIDALTKADVTDAFPRNPVVYAYGNSLFNGVGGNDLGNQGMIPSNGRTTTYKAGGQGAAQSYVLPLIGPMRAGDSNHEYSPYDIEVCFGALGGGTTVTLSAYRSGDQPTALIGSSVTVDSLATDKCYTIELSEANLISDFGANRMKSFILNMRVEGSDESSATVNSVEATWWDQYNAPR